jgi:hypothetical protein
MQPCGLNKKRPGAGFPVLAPGSCSRSHLRGLGPPGRTAQPAPERLPRLIWRASPAARMAKKKAGEFGRPRGWRRSAARAENLAAVASCTGRTTREARGRRPAPPPLLNAAVASLPSASSSGPSWPCSGPESIGDASLRSRRGFRRPRWTMTDRGLVPCPVLTTRTRPETTTSAWALVPVQASDATPRAAQRRRRARTLAALAGGASPSGSVRVLRVPDGALSHPESGNAAPVPGHHVGPGPGCRR